MAHHSRLRLILRHSPVTMNIVDSRSTKYMHGSDLEYTLNTLSIGLICLLGIIQAMAEHVATMLS